MPAGGLSRLAGGGGRRRLEIVTDSPAPDAPLPGERAVRVGAVLFALGVVGVLCVLVPFFLGRNDAPLWTTLLASLLPVGLGIALTGILRAARANRRAARRARRAAAG